MDILNSRLLKGRVFSKCITKQEGQVALNRSPEFCLKLAYIYVSRKLAMSLVTPGVGPLLAPGAYI